MRRWLKKRSSKVKVSFFKYIYGLLSIFWHCLITLVYTCRLISSLRLFLSFCFKFHIQKLSGYQKKFLTFLMTSPMYRKCISGVWPKICGTLFFCLCYTKLRKTVVFICIASSNLRELPLEKLGHAHPLVTIYICMALLVLI